MTISNKASTKLVLISGKMGSGKTTLRENLIRQLEYRACSVTHYSFARPIYEAASAVYAALAPYNIKCTQEKDRRLLQLIGTEWGRETKGHNVWVECARKFIASQKVGYVIIDDCRFPNELNFDYGVPTIKVRLNAAAEARRARGVSIVDETHPSETSLDDAKFDLVIDTCTIKPSEVASIVMAFLGSV